MFVSGNIFIIMFDLFCSNIGSVLFLNFKVFAVSEILKVGLWRGILFWCMAAFLRPLLVMLKRLKKSLIMRQLCKFKLL